MPLAAATLLPFALAGFRPTAAAAAPAIFWKQRIGCQSWGPSCWLPGFHGSNSTAALGPPGQVAVASYGERLCVLSPEDREVIWKGSGGGESTPVWIHAMQNCVSHPPHFRLRRCAATTGLAAQPYGITWERRFRPPYRRSEVSMRTPGLVFVGNLQSRLTAIDVATGTSMWRYTACPHAEIWSTLGGLSQRDMVCFSAGAAIPCRKSRRIVCSESSLLCSGTADVIGDGHSALHCGNKTGAMGTSTASTRPAVSHGMQISPPQLAASSAAADRAVTSKTASRTWARSECGQSRCTGEVIWQFALSSALRDDLDTFVGASPRRGTGVWRDILYVAGEDGYLYALRTHAHARARTHARTQFFSRPERSSRRRLSNRRIRTLLSTSTTRSAQQYATDNMAT